MEQDKTKDITLTAEEEKAITGLDDIAFHMACTYYNWDNKNGTMNQTAISFAKRAIIENAKHRSTAITEDKTELNKKN